MHLTSWRSLTDDLLYSGDVNAALRRLLKEGMTDRDGRRMEGLADLMERLRARREELLANSDLGSAVEGIGEELAEITDLERSEMDRQERAARQSGDEDWARKPLSSRSRTSVSTSTSCPPIWPVG